MCCRFLRRIVADFLGLLADFPVNRRKIIGEQELRSDDFVYRISFFDVDGMDFGRTVPERIVGTLDIICIPAGHPENMLQQPFLIDTAV